MYPQRYPSELALSAGIIPSPTFKGFFDDLLVNLQEIALRDNVTLSFQTEEVDEDYEAALFLLDPTCVDGETIAVGNTTYNCSAFDFLIGDFWPNPDRYELYDFTPSWLTTSLSVMKYTRKVKSSDITALTEAIETDSVICGVGSSHFLQSRALKNFPNATIEPCRGENPIQTCLDQLESEECSLFVGDDLVLRKIQSDKTNFEMTGEHLQKKFLAWPVRKNLDPAKAFLLNKWIYAALSSQIIDDLYTKHFDNKTCPFGLAGINCDLPCDPLHGMADATGACICESVRWSGADCSIEVPEELHLIPDAIKFTAYAMFGINASIIFVCVIWLYYHWWSPIVRFSQPLFLLLVLLGCLISSSTIVPMAQEDSGDGPVEACIVIPWLYSLGFSITFGTLFAKIRRVYSVFNQSERPVPYSMRQDSFRGQRYISSRDTLLTIGRVLLLDFAVLALWTAVDPMEWKRFTLREDQFGVRLESQGYCVSNHWRPFFGALVAIHILLVGLATFMCYKARGIPTQYSEHKFVTVAMVANLQLFILGIPVLIIASADPAAHFFVRSTIVWMNDLVIITLIFGNLMNKVRSSDDDFDMDKVQGAVDDIQRRRSGEHVRRSSLGESERSEGYIQRRNSDLHLTPRRSSLGNSERYVPAMPNVSEPSGSTGPSSIDLVSDEESSEIHRPGAPRESAVSGISLSGFDPSDSSDDDHNISGSHDPHWRPSKGRVAKSRFLPQAQGDVPMIPVRDQTIVEEIEDGEREFSSSTGFDETLSSMSKDGGSAEIQMHLPSIQEMVSILTSENRYRASFGSLQPPLVPSRSPSSRGDETCSINPSSSHASVSSLPMISPTSVLPVQRNDNVSPSETAPVKPMRFESEHEVIDHSGHTMEDRQVAIDLSFKSCPHEAPLQPVRFPSEVVDPSGHTLEDRQAAIDLSPQSNLHEAPLQPVRFLSEAEEIESIDFQIPPLPT